MLRPDHGEGAFFFQFWQAEPSMYTAEGLLSFILGDEYKLAYTSGEIALFRKEHEMTHFEGFVIF